jgi:hypothetical protein
VGDKTSIVNLTGGALTSIGVGVIKNVPMAAAAQTPAPPPGAASDPDPLDELLAGKGKGA